MNVIVQKAVHRLILNEPFWATLLLRMTLEESTEVPTAATDGVRIVYNPAFFKAMPIADVVFVLAHEVAHVANMHHLRMGARDPQGWNIACDYVVNLQLSKSGYTPIKGALIDSAFDNMSAEQVYAKLPRGNGQGQGGNGQGKDNPDPGGCGQVMAPKSKNGSPMTEAEIQEMAAELKVATVMAAKAARACGKLPAGVKHLVDGILRPRLSWQEILHQFLQKTRTNTYTWCPPNRRHIAQGLYLPRLAGNELRPLAIAVDTSASVSNSDLELFQAEINGILASYPCDVTVIYCDTSVGSVEKFSSQDMPIQLHAVGRGGTDFRPPFEYVERHHLAPACLIYLTDMECNNFPPSPDYPVLWVQVGNRDWAASPPFGDVARLQ